MQDLFYKLPASFQKHITEKLPCGCIKSENVNYELEIMPSDRYKINGTRVREYWIKYIPRVYHISRPEDIKVGEGRIKY